MIDSDSSETTMTLDKSGKPVEPKTMLKKSSEKIIVYTIGGGTYYEYEMLQSMAAETGKEVL
jgi:hypothetical protein